MNNPYPDDNLDKDQNIINNTSETYISYRRKWGYALLSGLLAFLLFNKAFYRLINSIFESIHIYPAYESNGNPSLWGTFFIALLFTLILRLLMS